MAIVRIATFFIFIFIFLLFFQLLLELTDHYISVTFAGSCLFLGTIYLPQEQKVLY